VIDPSAASFRKELQSRRKRGFSVRRANNRYMNGIRTMGALLDTATLTIDSECIDLLNETASFVWDDSRPDTPIMENDHCLDALRYATMEVANDARPFTLPQGF